ncbi:MAG: hydrolase TatD, partial [Prevotellaceae bacterium]|nr:hydrolase TatD [Prevotellaceae bacterium]
IVERLAEIYQTTTEHIEAVTSRNARQLFAL